MKDALGIIAPVAFVFSLFIVIGVTLSGWVFWAVAIGLPLLILGFLQCLFQVDIRLIRLMNGPIEKANVFDYIATYIHKYSTTRKAR
jgi:hypothetical protein